MDYLTKFYKNQSEVLAEKVQILEKHLALLSEAEAPASTFRGDGSGQQRFSDLELENQMRKFKKTGFFGAEISDDKQSREYLDAKAELERRRGAGKQQAPAPAPAPAPRPPVEQMGPKGSPSAVPTRTEVQRTQEVADRTGVPTALPTNTAPGTMSMTDMDGNPIAVQPRPKQSEGPVLGRVEPAQNTPQGRRELERSAMGKGENRFVARPTPADFNMAARANAPATDIDSEDGYQTKGGYLQSPTSWRSRYPESYQTSPKPASSDNMVQRAFSVPSRAPGTIVKPSDLTAVKLPSDFHGTGNMPPVDPEVQAADKPGRWSTNWNEFINSMRPQTPTVPGMSKPLARSTQFDSPFGTSQTSAYGTPPSAQYAPRESQVVRPKETGIAAIPPVSPQEIQNRDTKNERMVSDTARQALPSAVRDVVKQPAEEDFSKFWAGKPRYGDLELQNMLRQHRRTAIGGKELPLERQSIEYRAARAELMRRGKLKP
jgi:hypothetical protein